MSSISLGGLGFTLKLEPVEEVGKCFWELKRMGKVIGKGIAKNEKVAQREAMEVFLAVSKRGTKNKNRRSTLRKKLADYCEKRPYLVAHVTLEALKKTDARDITREAEAMEVYYWENDPPKYRVALPDHPLSLRPHEAAQRVWETFIGLGYLWQNPEDVDDVRPTKKLRKWAISTFGPQFLKEHE